MAVNDILREYLERVKTQITQEQSALGIRLTGTSAGSLQIERARSTKTGRFVAGATLASVAYLVTNFAGIGVKAGTFPPFGIGSKLHRWVIQRGITTVDNTGRLQTPAQTTFLIARKIGASGSRIARGASPGVDFQSIIRDELPDTMDEITEDVTVGILEDFNKAILL